MRIWSVILIITMTAFVPGFKREMAPLTIHGQITQNPGGTSGYVGGLTVFIRIGGRIGNWVTTDKEGNFTLTFDEVLGKRVNLFCCGIGMDTLLLYSATKLTDLDKHHVFFIPVKIKKNIFGKVYCPVCHRTDKVYKIVYSDNPTFVARTSQDGDIYSSFESWLFVVILVNPLYYDTTTLSFVFFR